MSKRPFPGAGSNKSIGLSKPVMHDKGTQTDGKVEDYLQVYNNYIRSDINTTLMRMNMILGDGEDISDTIRSRKKYKETKEESEKHIGNCRGRIRKRLRLVRKTIKQFKAIALTPDFSKIDNQLEEIKKKSDELRNVSVEPGTIPRIRACAEVIEKRSSEMKEWLEGVLERFDEKMEYTPDSEDEEEEDDDNVNIGEYKKPDC